MSLAGEYGRRAAMGEQQQATQAAQAYRATNCRACLGGWAAGQRRRRRRWRRVTLHADGGAEATTSSMQGRLQVARPIGVPAQHTSIPDTHRGPTVVSGGVGLAIIACNTCAHRPYNSPSPPPLAIPPLPESLHRAPSRRRLLSYPLLRAAPQFCPFDVLLHSMVPSPPAAICTNTPSTPASASATHPHQHYYSQHRAADAALTTTTTNTDTAPAGTRRPCPHSLDRTCSHHSHRRCRCRTRRWCCYSSLARSSSAFARVQAARMTARRHQPFATDSMPYPCC